MAQPKKKLPVRNIRRSRKWLTRNHLLLILIIIIGVGIRFYHFPGSIYFGYDQARDAFVSEHIYQTHQLILQGPPSGASGVFNGPLYYYVIGLLYTVFYGNPLPIVVFFIILSFAIIPLLYGTVLNLTKRPPVALATALLTACAYEQTQWSVFLSNIALANFGLALLFFGLSAWWFGKKSWASVIATTGFVLAVQSEIQLFYLVAPLGILWWLTRKERTALTRRLLVSNLAILFLGCLSYGLVGLRLHTVLFRSVAGFGTQTVTETASQGLFSLLERISVISFNNLLGFGLFLPTVFCFFWIGVLSKTNYPKLVKTFVLGLFFGQFILLIVPIGFGNTYGMSVGMGLIAIIMMSAAIHATLKPALATILIVVLGLSQLHLSFSHGQLTELPPFQKELPLTDERAVVAAIAQDPEALGVYALIKPLDINTTWAYLFQTYWPTSKPKPVWMGTFAKGYQGENVFIESSDQIPCNYFLISEPDGMLDQEIKALYNEEKARSEVIQTDQLGSIKLEKRHRRDCLHEN